MVAQSTHTIKIFYCYVQKDDTLREELARHLSPFRRLRYITGWYNRDIQAGTDWEKESRTHLDAANIILLLLSADFFASDYQYAVEMERAIRKHKAGIAYVIPILLRPVDWQETPIGEIQVLPANEMPVTQWANRDEAWLNVVQGIREVIKDLLQKQPLSSEENDVLYPEQGLLSDQIVGKKYLFGELLGEGGFSQVYKAQHIEMQRQQAIKVLHERHFRKQEFRDRFLREARTVASLDHHHIIHLDDFWTEASQAYLVMPFVSGGTLQGILDKQQGFIKQDQVIFYFECVCNALDYAHKQEIVHLDLKPLNLLVHEDGRLLLSDFGLAHLVKQGVILGGSSLRAGTPHYMAPEHINGSPEKRSDLFSLGVLLYQMLVGQLPFDGLPHETILLKNVTEWPPAPRSLRPDLPQSVENMLERALAKQPEQRYQTANEFLKALKNALAPSPQGIILRPTLTTPDPPVPIRNASALEQRLAPPSRQRLSAIQVTGALKQAQIFQTQGRFSDAIDLCEQILEGGFDRPDARYFLGCLYQEQKRWDEAIRQFQTLLNDPDYALSCYYALGQCYCARGDLRTAAMHFDEAVDRVNPDALTLEECDWLVLLCQEAADAHCQLGEQEQALTVYNALLGFLRDRGWKDKFAELEFMFKQFQNGLQMPEMVRLAPQDPRAHEQLGNIYINRSMIDEGIAELRLLADIYLRRNQLEQASEILRRIGNIYAEKDRKEEAFMNLRRAVELDPTNIDLLREVVGYCYQLDRPADAKTYQEKIARYYFHTHQVKEAVASLQQLIALDRNNFEAYDMLGQTYQSVGEYEQASRVYRNLAKINPGSSIANQRLAQLQDLRTRSE